MDVKSLYIGIPHDDGLKALKFLLDQRAEKNPRLLYCVLQNWYSHTFFLRKSSPFMLT